MNLEDLSGSAAKLLVCLMFNAGYQEMAGLSRKHYFLAIKELERSGLVQVVRKPPKPPVITLTFQVNGITERSGVIDRLKNQSDESIYLSIYPSVDAKPSEHDARDQFFPGFEPISGPIEALSTVVKKTTATVDNFTTVVKKTPVDSSENDYSSENHHSNSSQNHYSSEKDHSAVDNFTTVDLFDQLEEADLLPADEKNVKHGSDFWMRRQRQVELLSQAYTEMFPHAHRIPNDTLKKWLGKAANRGTVVYDAFTRARDKKGGPPDTPSTYINTTLANLVVEMESQSAAPRYTAKTKPTPEDDFAPYNGELIEETPEEHADRLARAERYKKMFGG